MGPNDLGAAYDAERGLKTNGNKKVKF
jgi:hypothetical protein